MNAIAAGEVNFGLMSGSGVHEKVIEVATPYLPRFRSVLVLGAGEGALEHQLIQRGVRPENIRALDYNPSHYKLHSVRCEFADLNTTFPIASSAFDAVFATELIEHLENPHNLIREAWRALKPGGMLFLSTPNVHSLMQKIRYLFSDRIGWFVEADYLGSGHLHPIFDWLLERMVRGKFAQEQYTSQTFHLRLIPYLPAIPMWNSRLFAVNNIYAFRKIPDIAKEREQVELSPEYRKAFHDAVYSTSQAQQRP